MAAKNTGSPQTADNPHPLEAAADTLLDVTTAKAAPILNRVTAPEHSEKLVELVQLEVAGSMAIDMVLRRYMGRVWMAASKLSPDDLNKHLLQSAVNPLVGAILSYVDDMPDIVRNAFLTAFQDTLTETLKNRRREKARAHGRPTLSRSSTAWRRPAKNWG